MKKITKILLTVLLVAFMMIVPIKTVQAKTITTLEVTESNGKISVSGTAEEGTLAVAIMVYDESGKNLVTMQTTAVESNNTYADTIEVESGTYVVKVADYDGGNFVTKTVSPKQETKPGDTQIDVPTLNPKDEVKEVTVGVDNAEKVKDVVSNSIKKDATLKAKVEKAIADGKDVKIEVVIKNIEETKLDATDKKEIDAKIKEEDLVVAQYLDLSIVVFADNDELGEVKELTEEITYTIAIPADLAKEGREFVVIRVHDGVAKILPTTMNDDGTLSFKTDRFSTYALAYTDKTNTVDKNVNTGDQSQIGLYATICGIALLVGVSLVVSKKRSHK